jgi:hypothetical protein
MTKKILNFLGLKMSEFHSGKYGDVYFETYPLVKIFSFWIRKPRMFQHLPYWTAKQVTFEVIIKSKTDKKLLSDIPIFSKPSDSSFSERIEIGEYCRVEDGGKKARIMTDGLRGSYILTYYFGSPATSGAKEIVELQANWKDKKWFIIYGLVGGFLGSLILFILGLLLEFIRINPAWDVFLVP